MKWKERIAREGRYFAFVAGGVLLSWTALAFLVDGLRVLEYWAPLLDSGHREHMVRCFFP